MNIAESIRSALGSVFANKMRSVLTMFGIIVGVSSVIMITALGQGFQNMITDEFSAIGLDKAQIYMNFEGEVKENDYLTFSDVDFINTLPEITGASMVKTMSFADSVDGKNPNEMISVNLYGVNEKYLDIENLEIQHGRKLARQDMELANNTAVVYSTFAKKVFGYEDAVGQTFSVRLWYGLETFTIIGVLEAGAGQIMASSYNRPEDVYLSATAFCSALGMDELTNQISVKFKDKNKVAVGTEKIIHMLHLKHENKDMYGYWAMSSFLEEATSIISIFTLFIGFVAAISLLVGGIGIMNIMLVSVTERTREIGIRKSLGATNGNILFQFLVEAVILTVMGGLLGILFGYLTALGLGALATMAMGMTAPLKPGFAPWILIVAVSISALIGMVSGVYPAGKAASLDPIEALRFEN